MLTGFEFRLAKCERHLQIASDFYSSSSKLRVAFSRRQNVKTKLE